MSYLKDLSQNHVPTDLNICGSGLVFREVRKLWKRWTKAEMRLELLKCLKREGLGVAQVEIQAQREAKINILSEKFKYKRNVGLIRSKMEVRIKDAYQDLREISWTVSQMKKRLHRTLRKKESLKQNIFNQIESEMNILKIKLQKKNDKKVKHLKKKFGDKFDEDTKYPVPDHLKLFSNIKLYSGQLKETRDVKVDIDVIGDVTLSEEELQVLRLPPNFAVLGKLTEEDFVHETEMSMTKVRWEKKKRLEEKLDEPIEVSEEEQEKIDEEEAKSRQIFDPIEKIIDMRKKRVTDMKENSRIYLPKPLPAIEEAKIAIRRETFENVFKTFVKEKCTEKGEQKTNLTWSQKKGLRSLKKRVDEGEIIIMMTDKSGKFAVADVESYLDMGRVHTAKDREVDPDIVRRTQKLFNGHTSMWLKFMSIGENWEHEDRMRESCLQETCSVPPMYLLDKDHKQRKEGELPATRPVVSGCSGMSLSMSNILSDIIESLADARQNPLEVISTEDLKSRIVAHNKEAETVDKDIKTVLIGCDAVALFPSLPAAESGRIVREATKKIVKQSNLQLKGMDFRELAKYIRMNMSDVEIISRKLSKIVPVRRFKKGQMPSMTGKEATKRKDPEKENPEEEEEDNNSNKERFIHPEREATKDEEILLFATALEIAVKFMFSNNLYQFGGRTYLQSDGGPIGLRVTMCIARMIMGEWGERMREILTQSGIKTYLDGSYVDDIRFVISCLPQGWRWEEKKKKFQFNKEWEEEDMSLKESDTVRMAREVNKAMNSIYPFLKFTVETEEDFENRRLPTLDCELWMEPIQDQKRQKVNFSFFQKSMKTPFVVMKESAMSQSQKISILSNDLIRRLSNCSETVEMSEKVKIIDDYTETLNVSGYSEREIKEIIESGLTGFVRKVEKFRKAGIPFHRPAAMTLQGRIKKKLLEKTNWYKQRPKGRGGFNPRKKKQNGNKISLNEKEPPASVMFCPQTPDGELAKRLREADKKLAELKLLMMKLR